MEGKIEIDVNVSPSEDMIWLSLDEMSLLFERDRSVIGKHIRSIYSEEELDEYTTRAKIARHLSDGKIYQVDIYNNVIDYDYDNTDFDKVWLAVTIGAQKTPPLKTAQTQK